MKHIAPRGKGYHYVEFMLYILITNILMEVLLFPRDYVDILLQRFSFPGMVVPRAKSINNQCLQLFPPSPH